MGRLDHANTKGPSLLVIAVVALVCLVGQRGAGGVRVGVDGLDSHPASSFVSPPPAEPDTVSWVNTTGGERVTHQELLKAQERLDAAKREDGASDLVEAVEHLLKWAREVDRSLGKVRSV
jgi:hypothetical protein